MESWLPALSVVVEVEGKRGTHTRTHTHNTRLRAHCSSTHTLILSLPYLGLGLHRQTQLFLGERREDGGREGAFLFQLSLTHPLSGLFCNLVGQKSPLETKGHSQARSETPSLSPPSLAALLLLFLFVCVQIKCSLHVAAFLVLIAPDLVRDSGWFAGLIVVTVISLVFSVGIHCLLELQQSYLRLIFSKAAWILGCWWPDCQLDGQVCWLWSCLCARCFCK